jgi:large repetitive protein
VPSDHTAVIIDTTVPAKPIINGMTDDTGTPIPPGPTGDTKPHMEGTGTPGDTITMYDGNTPIGSTIIGPDGKWSVEPKNPLTPGTHDIYVIETSPAGTPSVPSDHVPVVIDTTAPAAPVITGLSDVHGLIPNGGQTADTHPSMSGTGKAGDIVTLYDAGKAIGSAVVGADGKWTIKPTADLSNGSHDVYAIEKNAAGAQSQASDHVKFTVDTHPATTTPVITLVNDAVGPIQGNVPSGGVTDDTMPTIKGTGKPGELIYLYDNGRGCGDTIVDANGKWSIQIQSGSPLTNAVHDLTAYAKNSAGVWSLVSNHWSITVDTHVPAKPVINGMTDDQGHVLPNPTSDAHPSMNGTGTPGDTITMYDGSTPIGSTIVGPDGKWVVKPTTDLSNGTHDIYVVETSPAGVPSAPSDHTSVKIDTSVPATPSVPTLTDDNGAAIPAGTTTNDGHPHINGTGVAGDIITVYDGLNAIGSTKVGGNGNWTFTPSSDLATGSHNISVTETNAAGTSSARSDSIWFQYSTVAPPSAPTITGLTDVDGPFAGNVPAGGISSDAHPTVQGKGVSGDIIKVYDGSTLLGSTTVQSNGTWSFKTPTLSNASHSITATETNAGGTSAQSSAYGFNVDVASYGNAQIVITGVYDSLGRLVPKGGTTMGKLTVTVWLANPGSSPPAMYIGETRLNVAPPTKNGNVYTFIVDRNTNYSDKYGNHYLPTSNFEIESKGTDANGNSWITGSLGSPANWNFTNTNWSAAVYSQSREATHDTTSVTEVAAAQGTSSDTDHTTHAAQKAPVTDAQTTPAASSVHTALGEHDAFVGHAANGNETVDLNADPASYFKESTAHIEGSKGGAIDTLHLTGDHQILDLTSLTGKTAAAKISGIEVIDLGGQHNTLKLSLTDVLNLGETDLFQQDGKQQMMVQGKEGDVVDLSNSHIAGLAEGEWEQHGTTQVGGVTYNVYEHSGAHTELLVQQGVQIAVH